MPLFYGNKKSWLNNLDEDAVAPRPKLFAQKPTLPMAPEMPMEEPVIPNYQKRMMEDSPLPGKLFSDRGRTAVPDSDEDTDMTLPGTSGPAEGKPSTAGNFFMSLVNRYLPGFADRQSGKDADERKSGFQKEMEYVEALPPARQKFAESWKSAGSMNPLAIAKFEFDKEQDTRDRERRSEEQMDKYVERLGGKLGDVQGTVGPLQSMKDALGFDYNDYDPKTDTVGGKKVDLPGVNIPGLGRISAYSGEARNLQAAGARVFNRELKSRSGSTVVNQELGRLKDEFQSGKYNSEPEMLKALQDYEKIMGMDLQNIEAGYRPDVVSEYEARGGLTSKSLGKKGAKATPAGATGIVMGSDGKRHYTDGKNDLGVAD